jgi:outer membrane protein assembly factor BamB
MLAFLIPDPFSLIMPPQDNPTVKRPRTCQRRLILLLAALAMAAAPVRHAGPPKPLAPGAVTADWTALLGPSNDSTSPETPLLKDWPAGGGPDVVWEMPTGEGYAAPAIHGDRLVYFHRLGNEAVVECRHAETGEFNWEFRYPTDYVDEYGYSNGPRCPPVIDGDRVYTYGADGWLHCLKLETGELLWKRHLRAEYNLVQNFFGVGDTPLVEGELVIVNVGAPKGPCVAALDKHTGKTVWGVGDQWTAGYAAPVAATVNGRRRAFVFAGGKSDPPAGGLLAIDPKEGRELFRFPWRSRSYESVNATVPLVVDNQVFISASYRTGGVLLELKPDGGFDERWRTDDLAIHWTNPIHRDGYLYGFDGRWEQEARLVCLDWATGKLMWAEAIELPETIRTPRGEQTIRLTPGRASLLAADGDVLCLGEFGHLLWLDLSPEGVRVINRAWLVKAQHTWGMPVLSRGLLYVSQNEVDIDGNPPRLICYDLRGE